MNRWFGTMTGKRCTAARCRVFRQGEEESLRSLESYLRPYASICDLSSRSSYQLLDNLCLLDDHVLYRHVLMPGLGPVLTALMAFTTSMPSLTRPKTQ